MFCKVQNDEVAGQYGCTQLGSNNEESLLGDNLGANNSNITETDVDKLMNLFNKKYLQNEIPEIEILQNLNKAQIIE